jgi:hypothetical protein
VPDQDDWQETGARIDTLIEASASAGPIARERAEELMRLVTDLYGAGLERLLGLLHAQGALTDEVVGAIVADDLVAALLLVHGLHPESPATRIDRAVSPMDGVELLEVTAGGVARLRLPGGHGCGSAGPRQAVEEAVEAAAPEVVEVQFEESPAGLIPVSSLFSRVGAPGTS